MNTREVQVVGARGSSRPWRVTVASRAIVADGLPNYGEGAACGREVGMSGVEKNCYSKLQSVAIDCNALSYNTSLLQTVSRKGQPELTSFI